MIEDTTPGVANDAPTVARQYEDLLSAVRGIVWEADGETMRFTFVSDKAEEVLGYPARRWVDEPTFWLDHLHPDDRDWAMALCVDAARERRDHELEYRMLAADGRYLWLRETVTVDLDAAGRVRLRGVIVDIGRQKAIEEELARRDAILDAVRFAGERLLATSGAWNERVQDVLARLGEATGVSRVYIFENSLAPDGELRAANTHEWVVDPALSVIDRPQLQSLSYRELGLDRFLELMPRGEILYGHVRDMPEQERAEFEDEGTLSYVLVPIVVDGAWWGFIGFDECMCERESSRTERDALKAAADMLGAAMGRERELARRDAVLEAVRYAGERFLSGGGSWEDSIDEVLERLGRATGVSRVYLYENFTGPDGEMWAAKKHKWVQAELAGRVPMSTRTEFSYRAMGLGRWVDAGRRGEMLHDSIRDVPPAELRNDPPASYPLSYVLVPIYVGGAWWGFIRFDEMIRERDFSAMERDALKAAADTLGAAIGRSRADEELRESQRSMQALLSNLPGMAYRSRLGAPWRIDFVSEGALELTGYPPAALVGSGEASYVGLIDADDRVALRHEIELAIAAGQPFHLNYRITTADGTIKWVMEQGRAIRDETGAVDRLEGIITDVTDRIQARHLLQQRVEERTRELATLLSVSTSVASTLELTPLLGVILDQLRQVVDHVAAAIFALDDADTLRLLDYRGPADPADLAWRWRLSEAGHSREVIERRAPVIIPDVRADTPLAAAFREKAISDLGELPEYIASWMGVPLIVRDRVIGLLAVDSGEPSAYTEHHAGLAVAFATQAAVAIENAQLYEAAAERTRELGTLLEIARNVAGTLELEPLLGLILDEVRAAVEYDGAGIQILQDGELVQAAGRGPDPKRVAEGVRVTLADAGPIREMVERGEPLVIGDVWGDDPVARAYRDVVTEAWLRNRPHNRSWAGVPLQVRNRTLGTMVIAHAQPNHFTERDVELLTAMAAQAAVAIENARLYEAAEERSRELGTLLEIGRNVAGTLELEPLLGLILDEVRGVVDYHGAGIMILHEDELVQAAGRGPELERISDGIRLKLAEAEPVRAMLADGTPLTIGDVWGDDPLARGYRESVTEAWLRDHPFIRSWIGVPLQSRNRTVGLMTISYAEPNHYTDRDVELLSAMATHAAVAIENARLYEAAAGTAALEERQRLARELHDSVSQALFGIGLGARTARTLLDQDPAKAVAPVDYVLSLAEAGLAEMRALIFELRPEALAQEGLVAALEKQAAAMRARYGIAVEASLPAAIEAPQPVQEAIYRIAQEALHNIVKHARATAVTVEAASERGATTLRIGDDGVGFDPSGSFPGHLGLRSMAERAEKLGGTFAIDSAPGAGSTIRVSIPTRTA